MASREIVATRMGIAMTELRAMFGIPAQGDRDSQIMAVLEACIGALRSAPAPVQKPAEQQAMAALSKSEPKLIAELLQIKPESAQKIINAATARAGE